MIGAIESLVDGIGADLRCNLVAGLGEALPRDLEAMEYELDRLKLRLEEFEDEVVIQQRRMLYFSIGFVAAAAGFILLRR